MEVEWKGKGIYSVQSTEGKNKYGVNLNANNPFQAECSCKGFQYHKFPCKHIKEVWAMIKDGNNLR